MSCACDACVGQIAIVTLSQMSQAHDHHDGGACSGEWGEFSHNENLTANQLFKQPYVDDGLALPGSTVLTHSHYIIPRFFPVSMGITTPHTHKILKPGNLGKLLGHGEESS